MAGIINAKGICKTFQNDVIQQHVIRNLDASFAGGDFTVIMGASGSGKTTLLKLLAGIWVPTIGKIFCDDQCITEWPEEKRIIYRREHFGFVSQNPQFMEHMDIWDHMIVQGFLSGKDKSRICARCEQILRMLKIDEKLWHLFPIQLSGGEQQKCNLALALMNKPDILFADEPTGAQNGTGAKQMMDLLTDMREKGQTIILTTHDINSAIRGNRILYLQDGKIADEIVLGEYHNEQNMKERFWRLHEFLEAWEW